MQWQFCNYSKVQLHLTVCRRRHAGGVTAERFCAAFPRAGTSPSPWRLHRALSQPGELIPAINSHSRRRRSHFFPSALLHHRVAPPLAVVLVEPRQSFPATSTSSHWSCAPHRFALVAGVGRNRPAQPVFPVTGRNSATTALTVARLLQTIFDCTKPIIVFVVSP